MNLIKLAITTAFLMAQFAYGESSIEKKLFIMEKNYNAENLLVINTHINDSCKFVAENNEYMDFYWLMDGKTRKEIHPMIRGKIEEKVKFTGINKLQDSFKVRMSDLNELKHDLEDTTMEVTSAIINGACKVKSIIKLGPSAKYRKLNLKRTYCEVSTNFIGVPTGCKFLDLQGSDADTGEPLKVRFFSK